MSNSALLRSILRQIEAAKQELDECPPVNLDWYSRARDSASILVPWLARTATGLKDYVELVLNSRNHVRRLWSDIVRQFASQLPSALVCQLTKQLEHEAILLDYVGGNVVSKVIEKHLIAAFTNGKLESNGASDYPDLFLRSNDYTGLPTFTRRDTETFGAAIKGGRPVRVPDGLEVKTCRNGASVDCHYPHIGLHLALVFRNEQDECIVDDIAVAFLRKDNYRITRPKTGATTLKASFTCRDFVSLLGRHRANGPSH